MPNFPRSATTKSTEPSMSDSFARSAHLAHDFNLYVECDAAYDLSVAEVSLHQNVTRNVVEQ